MTGYIIAAIIAFMVLGFISKTIKFAVKMAIFFAVLIISAAFLRGVFPALF